MVSSVKAAASVALLLASSSIAWAACDLEDCATRCVREAFECWDECAIAHAACAVTGDPASVARLESKSACLTYFDAFAEQVEPFCVVDELPDAREDPAVARAIEILITERVFAPSSFDDVEILWCDRFVTAIAMVVEPEVLVLSTAMRGMPMTDFASILAHEMVHIEQYRRDGAETLECRYARIIAKGGGFLEDNPIENEAYGLEREIAPRLRKYRNERAGE